MYGWWESVESEEVMKVESYFAERQKMKEKRKEGGRVGLHKPWRSVSQIMIFEDRGGYRFGV